MSAPLVTITEPTIGYRRVNGGRGAWHVLKVTDSGPGAVHRSTLCGRLSALVIVGYERDRSEWARAKAAYCEGLVESLAEVEGDITCARCQKRVRTTLNEAKP